MADSPQKAAPLVGVTAIDDLCPSDWEAIRIARVEAIKASLVQSISDPHGLFVLYTVRAAPAPPAEYIAIVKGRLGAAYSSGVRWFEIHYLPNMRENGLGLFWGNGKEYAHWWLDVWSELAQLCPEAKWGFPAVRLRDTIGTQGADEFLEEAQPAVNAADFLNISVAWKRPHELHQSIWLVSDRWMRFKKPSCVQYYNPNTTVSKKVKARQYIEFCRALSDRHCGVVATFCHTLYSPQDKWISWRSAGGNMSPIPSIIGARDF